MPESIDTAQFISAVISVVGTLLTGALIGKIAASVMKVAKGGLFKYIVIGVIGSILGGLIADFLGFIMNGLLARLIVSVLGACLFIAAGQKLTSKTK